MKFEHILQVYWSKGFFFAGKLFYTNKLTLTNLFKYHLFGLSSLFKKLLVKRLELTTFLYYYHNLFYFVNYLSKSHKRVIKTINIMFSQVNNVNSSLSEQKKLNILRKYLLKSYQGYCHSLGKPVRGQRTWSNSWNSFKCNNILRNFITKVQRAKSLAQKNTQTKIDYRSVKKKYIQHNKNNISAKKSLSKNYNIFNSKSWY
jgi:ribosomal protein S13